MIGRIAGRFWLSARSRGFHLANTGARRRDRRPRLLRIERLEDRWLLAVTLSFRTGNTPDAPLADALHAGQTAYVRVDDPTIADGMVQVGVWEDDGAGDDQIATFMVHVQSGVGFTPWVTTWQGHDDGGPFNRYYLFASASNVYSDAPGAGHFIVRPAAANAISGAAHDGGGASSAVTIRRVDSAAPIETGLDTWIVTHGRGSSDSEHWVIEMTAAIDAAGDFAWQVLTIDWSAGAGGFFPTWVKPVGSWAGQVLADFGLTTIDVNLIGHSWGSYVMDELAEAMPGGVNVIVGLDPGAIPGAYSPAEVNFAAHSQWSVAYHSSDVWGNEDTPTTADAAFAVEVDGDSLFNFHAHTSIHDLFTYMIAAPGGGVSRLFDLHQLLLGQGGAWIVNRYDYDGTINGNYEGVIATVGSQGLVPSSITYIANGSGQPRTLFESDFWGDYNLDDTVNAADYTVWRNTLGSTTEMKADGSGNGVVDQEDYFAWKEQYGKTWPGLGASFGAEATVAEGRPQMILEESTAAPNRDLASENSQFAQALAEPVAPTRFRVGVAPVEAFSIAKPGRRVLLSPASRSMAVAARDDGLLAWLESRRSAEQPRDRDAVKSAVVNITDEARRGLFDAALEGLAVAL